MNDKWIIIKSPLSDESIVKCPVCGDEFIGNDVEDYNFCPVCGADMRGGANRKEDNHEYKCTECRHKGDCVRVSAFLAANVFPYSDGCESFEKESEGARTNGDLISREALKEDFRSRLAACNEWIEKAKDKETKIRASAVKAFIAEVVMTIDNAPTITPEKALIDKLKGGAV